MVTTIERAPSDESTEAFRDLFPSDPPSRTELPTWTRRRFISRTAAVVMGAMAGLFLRIEPALAHCAHSVPSGCYGYPGCHYCGSYGYCYSCSRSPSYGGCHTGTRCWYSCYGGKTIICCDWWDPSCGAWCICKHTYTSNC